MDGVKFKRREILFINRILMYIIQPNNVSNSTTSEKSIKVNSHRGQYSRVKSIV